MNEPDPNKLLSELILATGKELTNSIKNKIKKVWYKLEYGVTIEPEEGETLKKIAENPFYQLFKEYLGEHWSLKLIKVGIYLTGLNESGKRKRAKEVQDEAYRKYGPKGAKIIHIASTGILIPIMEYIIDLKLHKKANCFVLNQEFDKILDEWDTISIPVHRNINNEELRKEILKKMEFGNPIFFVYSAGYASKIAQLTLAQMNNEEIFNGKYLMTSKIKILKDAQYCIWTFDKVQDTPNSIISTQFNK